MVIITLLMVFFSFAVSFIDTVQPEMTIPASIILGAFLIAIAIENSKKR